MKSIIAYNIYSRAISYCDCGNDLDEIHLQDIVNHVDAYNHTNMVICCLECDYRDWLNSDLANMCDNYIIKILKGHKNE